MVLANSCTVMVEKATNHHILEDRNQVKQMNVISLGEIVKYEYVLIWEIDEGV
jgi:hypothetical protein